MRRWETTELGTLASFAIRLRFHDDRANPKFFSYLLRSGLIRQHLSGQGGGTNINNLNQGILSRLEVPLPSPYEQARIASILGAYDDLIEVNRRRVKLLEEMARGLFEEWFVRFRFPGHETIPLLDTPDGTVPEGWHLGSFEELARLGGAAINPGGTPEQIFAHYSLPAFDAGRNPILEQGKEIKSNKLSFESPAILVSKLNPRIPRVWYVPESTVQSQIASTEFVPLIATGACVTAWLYAAVRCLEFTGRLAAMAGGTSTSHQRVKPKDILNTPIVVPDDLTLLRTGQILTPIYELAYKIEASSLRLAASRDLLLPRLISGQLSLEAAEQMPEAAE